MKRVLDFASYNSNINESTKEIYSEELRKSYKDFYRKLTEQNIKYYLNRGLSGNFAVDDFQDGKILTFEPTGSENKIKFHLFKISSGIDPCIQSNGSLQDLLKLDLASINNYFSSIGVPKMTFDELMNAFDSKASQRYGGYKYTEILLHKWPNIINLKIGEGSYLYYVFIYYYSVVIELILDAEKKSASSKSEKLDLNDVLNLPEFKELEKLGFYSTTTPAIWKNGNVRFTHPFLRFRDVLDTITIYQGGPVRLTINSRPALVTAAPGFNLNTKEDWKKKISWANSYLKRKILKDKFGITSKTEQENLSSLDNEDFLMKLFEIEEEKFDNFLQEILDSPQAKEGILGSKGLIQKMIEQEPEKTARIFKEFYKEKEIEEAVRELPQKTQDEFKFALGILGDLSQLGF
jgi:hypothetical protein